MLMPSDERSYKDKIKLLKAERDEAYAAALRFVTGVINSSKELTEEQKSDILNRIWMK